jgi:hypothetical protein
LVFSLKTFCKLSDLRFAHIFKIVKKLTL